MPFLCRPILPAKNFHCCSQAWYSLYNAQTEIRFISLAHLNSQCFKKSPFCCHSYIYPYSSTAPYYICTFLPCRCSLLRSHPPSRGGEWKPRGGSSPKIRDIATGSRVRPIGGKQPASTPLHITLFLRESKREGGRETTAVRLYPVQRLLLNVSPTRFSRAVPLG